MSIALSESMKYLDSNEFVYRTYIHIHIHINFFITCHLFKDISVCFQLL